MTAMPAIVREAEGIAAGSVSGGISFRFGFHREYIKLRM